MNEVLYVYRCTVRGNARDSSAPILLVALLSAGCLNTQSVAFQEAPTADTSPAAACRQAAEADGWTVLDIHGLRQVSEGYWEARVEVDDPEMQELVRCRHHAIEGWTEVVELDE
ncbi:MAG: hypothetical protein ACE5FP_07925 [Gemmatimonadota bacterium]